jgi:hypothetical protein
MDEKDENIKEGITHLITRKNRHGEIGSDFMIMDKNTSTFHSYISEQDTTISPEQYNKKLTELVEYNNTDTLKVNTELSFRDKIDESDIPF